MKIRAPLPMLKSVSRCAPRKPQVHTRKVGPGHAKGQWDTISCLWKRPVMGIWRKHIRSDASMKFSISSPFQAICGLRTSWAVAYICVISFNSPLETFASIHLFGCFLNFRYLKHPVATSSTTSLCIVQKSRFLFAYGLLHNRLFGYCSVLWEIANNHSQQTFLHITTYFRLAMDRQYWKALKLQTNVQRLAIKIRLRGKENLLCIYVINI